MRINDLGLQHLGNISPDNIMNYYHGYGLGKRANKIGNGFYARDSIWWRSDNFTTPIVTTNLRNNLKNFYPDPFHGVFYIIENGQVRVIDNKAVDIATIQLPLNPYSLYPQGLATIDKSGNGLIMTDGEFIHINPNGTIRNRKSHPYNLTQQNMNYWGWVTVHPTKDLFAVHVYNGAYRYMLCKLSTLEILNNNLTIDGGNDEKFFFTKQGKIMSAITRRASYMQIIEIDYSNNTLLSKKQIQLPTATGNWTNMGLDKKGNMLFSNWSLKKIISVDSTNGTISDYMTFPSMTDSVSFTDFDEKYLYGYIEESGNIGSVVVYDIKTKELVKNVGGSYVYPIQFKGKLPITEAFF
ncbi:MULTISPECIES: hypothetical protein [Bacillus]|uniref:hypothetical protein n=1 Tax=Bacillus TaxID=1386 RepID=UPI0002DA8A37|nr:MULTISPECIES: hypothetical protein [Bacillus]